MIEEPGSFSGRISSPMPDLGPEPSRRMSLAILNRPVATETIAQCFELVGRGHERQLGELDHFRGEPLREFRMGIDAGADCRPALGQRIKRGQRLLHAFGARVHLCGVAGKFLAERERRCVL